MSRPRERIEARISSWFKSLEESKRTERREKGRSFATISRECGAYGTTIADILCEHLHRHERNRDAPWAVFDKELFQKVIDEHKNAFIQEVSVAEFHLYESVLLREGPLYKILETYHLGQ